MGLAFRKLVLFPTTVLLLLFLQISSSVHGSAQIEVSLVVFGSTTATGSASLASIAPTFEVAVEELGRRYSETFNFTYIQSPAHSCLQILEKADDVLAKWYYQLMQAKHTDGILVFISPGEKGCLANDLSPYDLAAAWNTLAINTQEDAEGKLHDQKGGADCGPFVLALDYELSLGRKPEERLFNGNGSRLVVGVVTEPSLLPTTLSLSYVHTGSYLTLYMNLMGKYNWTSIFILTDKNSAPVNADLSDGLANRITRAGRWIHVLHQMTSNDNTTFADVLMKFQSISRVLFFFGHASKLRKLLVSANLLNMTDGQYVYVATELFPFTAYGKLFWRYGDIYDELARNAFNSLLITQPVSTTFTPTETSRKLGDEFRRRSANKFNYTYSAADQALSVLIGSYNAILIFGQVLHETWERKQNLSDGQSLAKNFLNRSFQTDFGEVFIGLNGTRLENLGVTHFNSKTDQRELFLVQYANAPDHLETTGQIVWVGSQWPPANEPRCGYRGDNIDCQHAGTNEIIYGIFFGCLLLISSSTIIAVRWYRTRQALRDSGFFIQLNQLPCTTSFSKSLLDF